MGHPAVEQHEALAGLKKHVVPVRGPHEPPVRTRGTGRGRSGACGGPGLRDTAKGAFLGGLPDRGLEERGGQRRPWPERGTRHRGRGRGRRIPVAQPREDRPDQESPDDRLAPEADLAFGRVHVHVDLGRPALEENKGDRVPPLGQRLAVALDERAVQGPAVHGPGIDEGHQVVPGGPAHAGTANQAAQPQARLRHVQG
jgi:hypothetical protein